MTQYRTKLLCDIQLLLTFPGLVAWLVVNRLILSRGMITPDQYQCLSLSQQQVLSFAMLELGSTAGTI